MGKLTELEQQQREEKKERAYRERQRLMDIVHLVGQKRAVELLFCVGIGAEERALEMARKEASERNRKRK